jgi:hypothetical protein
MKRYPEWSAIVVTILVLRPNGGKSDKLLGRRAPAGWTTSAAEEEKRGRVVEKALAAQHRVGIAGDRHSQQHGGGIGRRAPLRQRFRPSEPAGLVAQFVEVILKIEDMLTVAVTAFVARDRRAAPSPRPTRPGACAGRRDRTAGGRGEGRR